MGAEGTEVLMNTDRVVGYSSVVAALAFGAWHRDVFAGVFALAAMIAFVKCLRNMSN